MSILLSFNGSNYIIPQTNEIGWGSNLDAYLVAIPAGCLQKTGGNFTLSAETDFGGAFGLKSLYLKSRTTNPAAAGVLRLANGDNVSWRNNINTLDLPLSVNTSNKLTFNGVEIQSLLTRGNLTETTSAILTISGGTNAIIGSGVTIAVQAATNSVPGYLTAADHTSFAGGVITANAALPSASFTDAAVTSKVITGYSSGSGTILITDTLLQAINKLNGNDGLRLLLTGGSLTGNLTLTNQYALILNDTEGTPKAVTIKAPTTLTANYNFILPLTHGAVNQYLTDDGAGNLSWTNAAGTGTVNSGTQYQLTYYASTGDAVSGNSNIKTNAAGQLLITDGTAAAPSLAFSSTGSADNGIYLSAADTLGFSTAGTERMTIGLTGNITVMTTIKNADGTAALPSYTFASSGNNDNGMFLSAANSLGFSTSGSERVTIGATGVVTSTNVHLGPDGSLSAPTYSFAGNTNTGMYNLAGACFIVGNGAWGVQVDTSRALFRTGSAAIPSITFGGDLDTGLYNPSNTSLGLVTSGVERIHIGGTGLVGINTDTPSSTYGGLDVASGGLSLILGADSNASTRTDTTIKFGRISCTHYTNAEQPLGMIIGTSESAHNHLYIGGGSSVVNAATDIGFYTAADNVTTTGTLRLLINSAGQTLISDGTVGAPGLAFLSSGNEDSGLYLTGSNAFAFANAGAQTLAISATGEITQPLQPSFLAYSGGGLNVTGDGTVYTCVFGTEVYDKNADFDGVSTFTAPATGTYLLIANILLAGILISHTTKSVSINTSNRAYNWVDNALIANTETTCSFSTLADMDAGDTAIVVVTVSGSTKVVDISSGNCTTYFTGSLIN